jgi:arsenate reductase
LDQAELERIVSLLPNEPAALVRKDKHFKELGLAATDYESRDAVVGLLLQHPRLMERPIAVLSDRAVIARPSDKVLEILAD